MALPPFKKGDLIERDKTVAEVTGPVTPTGAVTVLIGGQRKIVYAPQWTLKVPAESQIEVQTSPTWVDRERRKPPPERKSRTQRQTAPPTRVNVPSILYVETKQGNWFVKGVDVPVTWQACAYSHGWVVRLALDVVVAYPGSVKGTYVPENVGRALFPAWVGVYLQEEAVAGG